MFILYRILGGFAIGITSNLSPMYIAEVSPARLRGRFVSLNQLTIVLGILAAQLVNWLLAEPVAAGATVADIRESWNGQTGWRMMFWAENIPAGLFFVMAFLIPESPRWLAVKGMKEQAFGIMSRIMGEDEVRAQYEEMEQAISADRSRSSAQGLARSCIRRCAVC